MLRVKESEVQYLKQEINSLKDELQAAQRVRSVLFPSVKATLWSSFNWIYPAGDDMNSLLSELPNNVFPGQEICNR